MHFNSVTDLAKGLQLWKQEVFCKRATFKGGQERHTKPAGFANNVWSQQN